ncbi:thyroid transcription factor 1-associated protein 26 homolog [Genypterus blacodes]|uniref:thyroid transcription factor 1-associated protein 26 homolog n=1 Tax=Genypterus blacodes TaxID=154954 RepID=UPI003F757EB5
MNNKDKHTGKDKNVKISKNNVAGVTKKRKWTPEHKVYEGSVKEGQGFAFKRKQKAEYEYKKLLRKEKLKNPVSKKPYMEDYPEHLKHLYMAEAEKLKNEAWTNRVNRSKHRMRGQGMEKAEEEDVDDAAEAVEAEGDSGESGETDAVSEKPESTASKQPESLPISNRMKKKMQKKTSYQKTREEFDDIQEKRKKKKEDFLKNKQQKEEAIQKYKQKKMETFQMLSKKTKKGQPNLNLQMDYLLQKIQGLDK